MTSKQGAKEVPEVSANAGSEETLETLSEAIESGAGLPAVARAAARALGASVALIDRSSAVLAVAAASSAEESRLLAGEADDVGDLKLRVADAVVGELRYRSVAGGPPAGLLRTVSTLLALELERSRAPEWASDEAAGEFVRAVLDREVTDRSDILARASELGAQLDTGAGVLVVRAGPRAAQAGEWRSRVLVVALRALRASSSGVVAGVEEDAERADVTAIIPVADDVALGRAAQALQRELAASLPGFNITVARSRLADPADLYRAGKEAQLAANVAEADGLELLAFEDTGAYRLLLPAMSDDPGELERFYEETVAPLAAYDEQYDTELVATIEAYLDNDANVTPTATQLFTHRHTVRYRLERVKELSGHDITSTVGREKLGLGLKSMRVLGIAPPRGPATEPGTEAGRAKVRRQGED